MTTTHQLPPAGRKYIEAANRADQAARQAQLNNARQYSEVIRAVQTITCQADTRFKHFLNNDLICARCEQTALAILQGDSQ